MTDARRQFVRRAQTLRLDTLFFCFFAGGPIMQDNQVAALLTTSIVNGRFQDLVRAALRSFTNRHLMDQVGLTGAHGQDAGQFLTDHQ